MARPLKEEKKSEAMRVRLSEIERNAFNKLADRIDKKPSHIVRRMIREAVNGEPDFFADGIKELKETNRQIAAIGRNLNRLLKLVELDKPINGFDLKNEYDSLKLGYVELQKSYEALYARSKNRQVIDRL